MDREYICTRRMAVFFATAIALATITTRSSISLAQTAGQCVPATDCSNLPDGTLCSDGIWATTGDTCQGGFCRGNLMPRMANSGSPLSAWPTSDQRLDFMLAYGISRGPGNYSNASDGVPMVGGYAVSNLWYTDDNGIQPCNNPPCNRVIGTNFTCETGKRGADQAFIASFDPGFFDRPNVNAFRHYGLFLQKFRKENPKTLWGGYVSMSHCVDHPTAWDNFSRSGNDTPLSTVDCCLLSQTCGKGAGAGLVPNLACGSPYYVNVHDPTIAPLFQYRIAQAVSDFYPLPDFVFLDNAPYFFPDEGQCVPFVSGTDPFKACIQKQGCTLGNNDNFGTDHRGFFVYEQATPVTFQELISHFSGTLRQLNQLNIRGMINVNMEPWWLQTCYEKGKPDVNNPYPAQFLNALLQRDVNGPGHTVANGISVENAFRVPFRFSPARSAFEVQQYREWLKSGIAVALNAYDKPGRWDAAMAMMMREPGQSVFVERDDANALDDPSRFFVATYNGASVNSLPWPKWPSFYGPSVGAAVWNTRWSLPGITPDYFESFYIKRQYDKKSLYVVHALVDKSIQDDGCSTIGSVNLATLLQTDIPSTTFQQLKLGNLTGDPPQDLPKGTFEGGCYTVTNSTIDNDTDFFTLASSDCGHNPPDQCAIDVEVAIGIVCLNPNPDPNGIQPPPDTVPVRGVSISPNEVVFGGTAIGTVTIDPPAIPQNVTVTLNASAVQPVAKVPACVVVLAGSTTATFTITTTSPPQPTKLVTVTISASAGGVTRSNILNVVRELPPGG